MNGAEVARGPRPTHGAGRRLRPCDESQTRTADPGCSAQRQPAAWELTPKAGRVFENMCVIQEDREAGAMDKSDKQENK